MVLIFSVQEFLYFLLVLLDVFEVKHGAEDMVPECRTHPKSHVSILIMVQVMIAPVIPHPLEWRAPGMDSIVDGSIEQVA